MIARNEDFDDRAEQEAYLEHLLRSRTDRLLRLLGLEGRDGGRIIGKGVPEFVVRNEVRLVLEAVKKARAFREEDPLRGLDVTIDVLRS